MGATFTWPLLPDPAPSAPSSGGGGTAFSSSPIDSICGFGLLRPFQRDQKNDYATDGGAALVRSAVGQILGTRAQSGGSQGEIPWRPELGSKLYILKMRKGPAQNELARAYAQEALRRWEPRVSVTRVTTEFDRARRALVAHVDFNLIDRNKPGNNVLLGGLNVAVAIP